MIDNCKDILTFLKGLSKRVCFGFKHPLACLVSRSKASIFHVPTYRNFNLRLVHKNKLFACQLKIRVYLNYLESDCIYLNM